MPLGRYSGDVDENHSLPASSHSNAETLDATIASFVDLDADQLRLQWRNHLGGTAPSHLPRWLLLKVLAYRLQAVALGGLDKATVRCIRASQGDAIDFAGSPFKKRKPRTRDGTGLNPGALLVREWKGKLERVMVLDKGFAWNGETFGSLSNVAKAVTGTSWNGHRFFGLRSAKDHGPKGPVAGLSGNKDGVRGASMGRLTLNMLLSFAQFEREITGERIDKVAASKKRGIWMGGAVPFGYRVENRALYIVEEHAKFVRELFRRYLEIGGVVRLKIVLDAENVRLPVRVVGTGRATGGGPISRGHIYHMLSHPIYVGRLRHKGQTHDGVHAAIVDRRSGSASNFSSRNKRNQGRIPVEVPNPFSQANFMASFVHFLESGREASPRNVWRPMRLAHSCSPPCRSSPFL
jgi:hypothetical protein